MEENNQSYEALMEELTKVLKVMEDPAANLEDQLNHYEKGMTLCQKMDQILKSAEEKIMLINARGEESEFE